MFSFTMQFSIDCFMSPHQVR